MPFPSDEQLMKTAAGLVEGFQTLFGNHPGFRPGTSSNHFSRISTNSLQPTPKASSSAAHLLQQLKPASSHPLFTSTQPFQWLAASPPPPASRTFPTPFQTPSHMVSQSVSLCQILQMEDVHIQISFPTAPFHSRLAPEKSSWRCFN